MCEKSEILTNFHRSRLVADTGARRNADPLCVPASLRESGVYVGVEQTRADGRRSVIHYVFITQGRAALLTHGNKSLN